MLELPDRLAACVRKQHKTALQSFEGSDTSAEIAAETLKSLCL